MFDDPIPGHALAFAALPKLRSVFADDLARAIFDDGRCTAHTHEVCLLESDVLFGSQDPAALVLTVVAASERAVDVCFKDNRAQK